MGNTLLTGSVDMETRERYFTVADLSLITGTSVPQLEKWRANGIITPVLFKGRIQFNRGALLRVQAMRALQSELGANHPLPARIVKQAGPRLDALGAGPQVFTADATNALVDALVKTVWTKEVDAAVHWRLSQLAHA